MNIDIERRKPLLLAGSLVATVIREAGMAGKLIVFAKEASVNDPSPHDGHSY